MVDSYRRLAVRRGCIQLDIWFIHQCRREKVIPTFAKVKISRNVPHDIKVDIEEKLLKKAINQHYAKLNKINVDLKIIYDQLCSTLDYHTFQNFLNDCYDEVNFQRSIKREKLERKLNGLIRTRLATEASAESSFSDHIFHERVKNLSDTHFTTSELELLSLGLKFCFGGRSDMSALQEFSIHVDCAIERLSNDPDFKRSLRDRCLALIQRGKRRRVNTAGQFRVLKDIKRKITDHDLVISKADKGNCLVIMNRADYIVKVETFLSQNNFQELNNNPMNSFIRKAKENLRMCEVFLTEHNKLHILPSNPAMPRLYGLPKIHKLDIPIRPVVSFCNTPMHELSTFLNSFIKSITDYKPRYSILNSVELTHKLQDLEMKDTYIMLSFDVCNLFTSIPREECIPLVSELLHEHDVPDSTLSDVLTLLKLALSQDFFIFNNVVYRQTDGLAMGSPLSSLLSGRFLEKLEAYIMSRWKIIVRWYRYVDDVFVILDGVPDDAHALLDFINTVHPNIKFTLELEVNRSINFLDLTISRSADSSLTFEIYRKNTQTDHIIPARSCHPRNHKMAALRCYIHRALNIPLSQTNREKELNIIRQIALNNGYDPKVIDTVKNSILNRQRRILAYSSDASDNTLKYCSLPYIGHLSEAISHVLERSVDGFRISCSGVRSLGSLLVNSKDTVKKLDRSGIYKLNCGECDTSYVGQTRRKLITRIKKHLSRPQLSTFGHHLTFSRHQFSPNRNSEILHNITGNKYSIRMNLFEDLEIGREMQSNSNCVNSQVNLNNVFTPLFKRLFPR